MTVDGEAAVTWQGISKVPNREKKFQIPAHFVREGFHKKKYKKKNRRFTFGWGFSKQGGG